MARGTIARLAALIIASLFGATVAHAAGPKWCDSLHHRVSVELRPAYHMVSHYAMRQGKHPLNNTLSLHARYSFTFSEDSHMGELFPTAYQGIGIAAYTYWEHNLMGTPMALYIFQGARIADLTPTLSVGYEWNLGYSWGWHPNNAMNSRGNVMINVAIPFAWRVAPHLELSLTPDFTHFSNGDTAFANAGSNMFGLRIGATYLFSDEQATASARRFITPSNALINKSFAEHMTYDIMAYGGWRADRFIENETLFYIDKALPIAGINFQPTYHLNDYFGIGASLDVQFDSSLNLYGGVKDKTSGTIAYMRPSLWEQTEVGLSVRGEISAPIFTVGVGFGVNMHNVGYDMSRYYTSFSLKAHLTRQLFLYVGYRFNSTQYTHNLMYGIGIRL
ncbi:MAG: acyloxyacyl hydrolase [Alistipes sp.]|nr:acyloxyacyl hydrolase [Alistipes sp.]